MMISTNMIRTVNVQHLTVGHKFKMRAPKNDSSLALFSRFSFSSGLLLLNNPPSRPYRSSSIPPFYLLSSARFASSSLLLRSLSSPRAYKSYGIFI